MDCYITEAGSSDIHVGYFVIDIRPGLNTVKKLPKCYKIIPSSSLYRRCDLIVTVYYENKVIDNAIKSAIPNDDLKSELYQYSSSNSNSVDYFLINLQSDHSLKVFCKILPNRINISDLVLNSLCCNLGECSI